jgi:hypothetical protein
MVKAIALFFNSRFTYCWLLVSDQQGLRKTTIEN